MNTGLPLPITLIERKLVDSSYDIVASGRPQITCVAVDDTATGVNPKFQATYAGRYLVIVQCDTNNKSVKIEHGSRAAEYNSIRFTQYMEADVTVNSTLAGSHPNYTVTSIVLDSWSKLDREFNNQKVSCPFFIDLDAEEVASFTITGTDIETWQLFIFRLGMADDERVESLNIVTLAPTKLDDTTNLVTVTRASHITDSVPLWRVRVTGSPANVKLRWTLTKTSFSPNPDQTYDFNRAHVLKLKLWKVKGHPGGGNVRLRWRRDTGPLLHDLSCDIPTGEGFNETTASIAVSSSGTHFLSIEEIANGDDCEIQATIEPA